MDLNDAQIEKLATALRNDPFQVNGKVLGVVVTILLLVGGWMGTTVNGLSREVAGLRADIAVMQAETILRTADRFTRTDAYEMESLFRDRLGEIDRRVQVLESR